jgi:hypothetical protein
MDEVFRVYLASGILLVEKGKMCVGDREKWLKTPFPKH